MCMRIRIHSCCALIVNSFFYFFCHPKTKYKLCLQLRNRKIKKKLKNIKAKLNLKGRSCGIFCREGYITGTRNFSTSLVEVFVGDLRLKCSVVYKFIFTHFWTTLNRTRSDWQIGFPQLFYANLIFWKVTLRERGVVNGPLKNEKSRQILSKSRNLAQPTNGSRSLRFCVCRSRVKVLFFYFKNKK